MDQTQVAVFSGGPFDGTMIELPAQVRSVSWSEPIRTVLAWDDGEDRTLWREGEMLFLSHYYEQDITGVFLYQGIE